MGVRTMSQGRHSKRPLGSDRREEKIIMSVSKNKIRMLLRIGGLFIFLIFLSQTCWSAGSMGADAYKIEKDVLNGGIQGIASDVYSAWSSVGQSVAGNMQGDKFALMGGFWSAFTYFVAGDANNDEVVTTADVVYLINYLFIGGPSPVALPSGDANCDGVINIADVIYLINYLFIHGPAPEMCDP
jgi:hypothetical protein